MSDIKGCVDFEFELKNVKKKIKLSELEIRGEVKGGIYYPYLLPSIVDINKIYIIMDNEIVELEED